MKADQSLKDNVFNTCVILILLCLALVVVVPFLFTFFSSFANGLNVIF